uniref:Uncharacterized protein n=1 Tax=Plectus sambesii TaxID=2011161 RepID=A0A914WT45_9BILA
MNSQNFAFWLFVFGTAVLYADAIICQKMPDVCVPAQDIQVGCQCALTTQKLLNIDKRVIPKKFLKPAQDVQVQVVPTGDGDIRFEILSQEAIDALNRFFSGRATNAVLDQNVFKSINVEVSIQLMTLPQYNVQQAIDLNSNELSPPTRDLLINCKHGICEQPGVFNQNAQRDKMRNFMSEKAMRFDIGNDTMIAFVRSTSSFYLENIHNQWEEKNCHSVWIFWEKCHTEQKYSETVREFTAALQKEWNTFVDSQMVKDFRTHNNNLLS